MKKFDYKDDFLAKWAGGSLSDKEKEDFMKTNDYKYFKAILDGTNQLQIPAYDKSVNYSSVRKKISKEKKKAPLLLKWTYTVAASIALLIGIGYLFNQTINYKTGYGELMSIKLPDSSEVILNSKSKIEYEKKKWKEKRTLTLDGEAYFKVNKGSLFTVDTDNGSVTVLGTKFTINSGPDIFEIVCYEGKVNVKTANSSKIIAKGEAMRIVNNTIENWDLKQHAPSWLQNESSFISAPLSQVINALERQYNLRINSESIDTSLRFTGGFTHYDMKTALSIVFNSMGIKFTFDNERTIYLSKK